MIYKFTGALIVGLSLITIPLSASALMAMPPVACTMDAKMCPDGSYVGRVAPNCEFQKCPGEVTTPPTEPAPMPPVSRDTLKRGSSNDAVKDIQTILKSDPTIYNGPVTGYYGALTESAIKKLQAKYGLPQTGIIDDATAAVLYPVNSKLELTVVTPNGGETWKTGEMQTIYWKSTWSAYVTPMPTVDSSSSRVDGGVSAGSAADRMMAPTSVSASRPAIMPQPTPVRPFFARATLELVRDGDASFVRSLGTVNLYDSSKTWKIPAGLPEAKDYRVRITYGAKTPCLYRAEIEAKESGRALDTSLVYPCPMQTNTVTTLAYPAYSASDASDAPFAIVAGTSSNDQLVEVKRQIAELEALLAKIMKDLARLKEVVGAMGQ